MPKRRVDKYILDSSNLIAEKIKSDSARLDAELLIAEALKKPRSFLYSHPEYKLTGSIFKLANHLISLRCKGFPVAYLLGKKDFWNFELDVNSSVLIPRPETELLVEFVLKLDLPKQIDIIDLGTGTGAIALALALERKEWNVTAVDLYDDALEVARKNFIKIFGEKSCPIHLIKSDWFSNLSDHYFDVIISNPPYINSIDDCLEDGDVSFEPKNALVSSLNGLGDIISIVEQSRSCLKNNGYLIIEHGFDQSKEVSEIFISNNFFNVNCYKDLSGIPRFTVGIKKN